MFDILGIQYKLGNGFRIGRDEFVPETYLISVDEPEFGCEGRPEGEKTYALLKGVTMTGIRTWRLDAEKLDESGLFDDMWVGNLSLSDGSKKLVTWRDGAETWSEIPAEIWDMLEEQDLK